MLTKALLGLLEVENKETVGQNLSEGGICGRSGGHRGGNGGVWRVWGMLEFGIPGFVPGFAPGIVPMPHYGRPCIARSPHY